jgi:hypothetical protein
MRRTKSIGTKVTADDYERLARLAEGQTLSEWVRGALLATVFPQPGDHLLLAEVLALRTIVLNLQFAVANGEAPTVEAMKRLIERADDQKHRRACERLTASPVETLTCQTLGTRGNGGYVAPSTTEPSMRPSLRHPVEGAPSGRPMQGSRGARRRPGSPHAAPRKRASAWTPAPRRAPGLLWPALRCRSRPARLNRGRSRGLKRRGSLSEPAP